ncbi:hypothetical protein P7C70_g5574, partial [Phenoliferia sp. Uapishka_3]
MTHYTHGFKPVDRNPALLNPKHSGEAPAIPIQTLLNTIPNTHLVRQVIRHLRPHHPILSDPIWNYSYRTYLHGKLSCEHRAEGSDLTSPLSGGDGEREFSRVGMERRDFLYYMPLP